MKINENGIERQATAEEIDEIKKAQSEAKKDHDQLLAQIDALAAAKASARAKLAALGLSEAEVAALLGA